MYHCTGSNSSLPALARPPKKKTASGDVIVTTSASARPSTSPVNRKVSSATGSPSAAAADTIEASKSSYATARRRLGSVIRAIVSNAVRLTPVADT